MKMIWKKVSYRFLTIVLLDQLFYNDNEEHVVVKIKGDELKNRLQNKEQETTFLALC